MNLRVQRLSWRFRFMRLEDGYMPLAVYRWEVVSDYGPVRFFARRSAAEAFVTEADAQLAAERLYEVEEVRWSHADECGPHSVGGPDHCGLCGRQFTEEELAVAGWPEAPRAGQLPTLLEYLVENIDCEVRDEDTRHILRLTSHWLKQEAEAFGPLKEGVFSAAMVLYFEAERPVLDRPSTEDVHSSG